VRRSKARRFAAARRTCKAASKSMILQEL
jgi:hypothetical protein